MSSPESSRPVSPAVLHILLALSAHAMHGYGIIKEVERLSARQYRLGPGTLYDNLRKLIEEGWVEDLPADDASDQKRRYRLTSIGTGLLATELARLESVLKVGRKRLRALQGEEA